MASLARELDDLGERAVQVALDVVAERLQRRDVHDLGAVGEAAGESLTHELVDAGEKRSERLAGAGRGGDERAPSGEDVRPAEGLRLGRAPELRQEPVPDHRVGPGERRRLGRGRPHPHSRHSSVLAHGFGGGAVRPLDMEQWRR